MIRATTSTLRRTMILVASVLLLSNSPSYASDSSTAPDASVTGIAVQWGGLHCETCSSQVGYWDGDNRCIFQLPNPFNNCEPRTEHRFNGFHCGGGGEVRNSASESKVPMKKVVRTDEEGGGWCAACGGSSDCHQEAQLGGCHVQCGGGGGGSEAMTPVIESINAAIRIADAALLREAMSSAPLLVWNDKRSALQLLFECDSTMVRETITVATRTAELLRMALSE